MDVQITCLCPPKDEAVRHPDGDTITLRDKLTFVEGKAVQLYASAVDSDDFMARGAEALARLSEGYVLWGIAKWSLVDEKGKPISVGHTAIREHLLSKPALAGLITEEADVLYKESVYDPLALRALRSSVSTSTTKPTSLPTVLAPKPRRPSKRSSTSTTRTAGTETTSSSLAGVSNSSQSSESAA